MHKPNNLVDRVICAEHWHLLRPMTYAFTRVDNTKHRKIFKRYWVKKLWKT